MIKPVDIPDLKAEEMVVSRDHLESLFRAVNMLIAAHNDRNRDVMDAWEWQDPNKKG